MFCFVLTEKHKRMVYHWGSLPSMHGTGNFFFIFWFQGNIYASLRCIWREQQFKCLWKSIVDVFYWIYVWVVNRWIKGSDGSKFNSPVKWPIAVDSIVKPFVDVLQERQSLIDYNLSKLKETYIFKQDIK